MFGDETAASRPRSNGILRMFGTRGATSRKRPMMQSLTAPAGSDLSAAPKAVRWIPKPDVPVSPVLSLAALLSGDDRAVASVVDVGRPLFLTAGRMAIAQALRIMGVAPGDKVLLPAYHCAAMVEPLSLVGAEAVFYRLRENLTVDMDDIAAKVDGRVRVLIATNYFGFPNSLTRIRAFCDDHGLKFLEDCAHSLFGTHDGRPLGSFGHYAIASATKFFPVRDGGCLVSAAHPETLAPVRLRRQPPLAQVRQVFDTVEEAVTYGRLPLFALPIALAKLGKVPLRWVRGNAPRPPAATNPGLMRAGVPGEFDGSWVDVKGTWVSARICRAASRRRIARRRRRNFQTLVDAFSGYQGFRPCSPSCPRGWCPTCSRWRSTTWRPRSPGWRTRPCPCSGSASSRGPGSPPRPARCRTAIPAAWSSSPVTRN